MEVRSPSLVCSPSASRVFLDHAGQGRGENNLFKACSKTGTCVGRSGMWVPLLTQCGILPRGGAGGAGGGGGGGET